MHWREHGSEDWTLGRNVCDLIANFKHNEQEQDFVLFIFYMNVAYMGTCWPHPPICEYVCGQHFVTIHMHVYVLHLKTRRMPHAILPSLPYTILPEGLPQLVMQDCCLTPEPLELLIFFGHTKVTP